MPTPTLSAFLTLTICSLGLSTPAAASIIDVIQNGGFEAGNTGFTSEFTDLSPGLAFDPGTRSTTDPVTDYFGVDAYEGDWMLAVSALGQPDVEPIIWAQDLWLEAGVTYEYSLWMAPASGGTNIELSNRLNGVLSSFFATGTDNEDVWGGYFTSFGVAVSGSYEFSIVDLTAVPGAKYAIDNISVTYEVPDAQVSSPSGGILFLTGLMGLVVQRRGKRFYEVPESAGPLHQRCGGYPKSNHSSTIRNHIKPIKKGFRYAEQNPNPSGPICINPFS